jgi:hypothetical protein
LEIIVTSAIARMKRPLFNWLCFCTKGPIDEASGHVCFRRSLALVAHSLLWVPRSIICLGGPPFIVGSRNCGWRTSPCAGSSFHSWCTRTYTTHLNMYPRRRE